MSCAIRRIITFNTAFIYGPIIIYNDSNVDISQNCLYSWSGDGVCWTNWVSFAHYNSIAANIENDMFWRVRIMDSLKVVLIDNVPTTCYTVTLDNANPFLQEFCGTETLFNPYANLDCALLLQQQTADSIICMLGIPIYYFKVDPDHATADYTFKEYLLHNVTDVKQIRMMIEDGQMPSSKPIFADDDFNWEVDWNVELSKTQFARAFGDNAFPSQRDIIYVPLMKRLWEVNSAWDEKQEAFMWRSTTWNLGLIKYNDKPNVREGDFEELIQSFVDNKMFETFGKYEDLEQERVSGTTQATDLGHLPNNLYNITMQDAIRKEFTPSLRIVDKNINQRSTIVSHNSYQFKDDEMVIYQRKPCTQCGALSLTVGDRIAEERNFTLFEMGNVKIEMGYDNEKGCGVIYFGELASPLYYEYMYHGNKQYSSDFLILTRWNKMNFTIDLNIYPHIHRLDVPEEKLKPTMWYYDPEHPVCSLTGIYNTEYSTIEPVEMILRGCEGLEVGGLKVFNAAIDLPELQKEALKYTTNNPKCIVNDCVKPWADILGFAPK